MTCSSHILGVDQTQQNCISGAVITQQRHVAEEQPGVAAVRQQEERVLEAGGDFQGVLPEHFTTWISG